MLACTPPVKTSSRSGQHSSIAVYLVCIAFLVVCRTFAKLTDDNVTLTPPRRVQDRNRDSDRALTLSQSRGLNRDVEHGAFRLAVCSRRRRAWTNQLTKTWRARRSAAGKRSVSRLRAMAHGVRVVGTMLSGVEAGTMVAVLGATE